MKAMLKKIRKWTRPSFLKVVAEINRIRSIPRFQQGSTMILGKKLLFTDSASFIQSYHEIFEQQVYLFHADSSRPLIIDCGSNIGLSILFFKRCFPAARIIGFEPDPGLFELLQANLNQFGLTDVEVHQKAVLDVPQSVTFSSQGGSSGHLDDNREGANQVSIPVEAVALHPFITEPVDLLKIDIEGAEFRVLTSLTSHLHLVRRLFVEYHSMVGKVQELDQLLSLLRNAGFRYYIFPAVERKFPFQGLEVEDGMDMQLNIYAIR